MKTSYWPLALTAAGEDELLPISAPELAALIGKVADAVESNRRSSRASRHGRNLG
jgi:hypothetical protein